MLTRALLAGACALVVAAVPAAVAGNGNAPFPNDSTPYWSWDAREVAFTREEAGTATRDAYEVAAGHGPIRRIESGVARGWQPRGDAVLIETADRTAVVAQGSIAATADGTLASWSPDGSRFAYVRGDGVFVSDSNGTHERRVASGFTRASWDVTGPVWSPDGTRIVFSSGSTLLVANVDPSGSRVLYTGENQNVNPSWSPDGRTIAFESNAGPAWTILEVNADGSDPRRVTGTFDARFPRFSPVSGRLAYISDQPQPRGGVPPHQYALYVFAGATVTKLADDVNPTTPPSWSPTGAQIAFAAGRECRRWGIYVVEPSAPARQMRRTNLCRFEGTARNDVIHGTPYLDFIQGLAGNDRIDGRAGRDRIEGNGGNDVLIGGPGADAIFGGAGNDRIEARDATRDVIDCGPGRDWAEVDRVDVVRNCETVRR